MSLVAVAALLWSSAAVLGVVLTARALARFRPAEARRPSTPPPRPEAFRLHARRSETVARLASTVMSVMTFALPAALLITLSDDDDDGRNVGVLFGAPGVFLLAANLTGIVLFLRRNRRDPGWHERLLAESERFWGQTGD